MSATSAPAPPPEESSDCRILPAFLLGFFFGIFGAHRFYVGKIGTAFLQLFTFGGLGIWATIDWILILCKAFKDKKGRRITKWT
jgi:TM2 domain-containing membrane protein YozV